MTKLVTIAGECLSRRCVLQPVRVERLALPIRRFSHLKALERGNRSPL